jgi:Fic family protein
LPRRRRCSAQVRDPRDVDEVVNYVEAMNHGLARLGELPVSVRLIREIHARLLRGVRGSRLTPGDLRISQNWIGPSGSTLRGASFVPPPPHVVPEALADLERFLHASDDLPPVVKIGLAHAQFETIHPFLDGNGRVGRLLITFLLTERAILHKPVLYLSHYFKRHRATYYDLLQAVRDEGDWEGWLAFFLRGVAEVSAEAAETARRILLLREEHRTAITSGLGRGSRERSPGAGVAVRSSDRLGAGRAGNERDDFRRRERPGRATGGDRRPGRDHGAGPEPSFPLRALRAPVHGRVAAG